MSISTVTSQRVVDALAAHGFDATADASGRGVQANVGDFGVMLVILDSVLIVRTSASTTIPSDSPDAIPYLAANQINSAMTGVRAIVANREATLVMRTESEIQVAAGLSDDQLSSAVKRAVDAVVYTQDALVATTEQFTSMRDGGSESSD